MTRCIIHNDGTETRPFQMDIVIGSNRGRLGNPSDLFKTNDTYCTDHADNSWTSTFILRNTPAT